MKNKIYKKKQVYTKNQIYIIILVLFGFIYSIFSYNRFNKSIKDGILVERVVISQSCRPFTKLASGVMIKEGNKKYSVDLDYNDCIKYSVNGKIKLKYDKKRDVFIYPVKTNYGNIYFLGITLLLSLVPWMYFIDRLRKK
ncbi:hypothetical protein [Flavobacterium tructae]|uniref:hypothetical protein n=1 Tax=Flavobacterium tructae TaxID=1114873 RepID=UPI0035A872F3